ncbi:MAG: lactonase family protein [Burkholderiaceae bacterium]
MTAPMTAPPAIGRSIVCVSDSGSGEIVVLVLDAHRGVLEVRQRVALGGTIMPLTPSPDRTRLYVARRSPPLAVVSLAIDADGQLSPLAEADLPASMAFLATDGSGRWLFSASYGGDVVAVSRVDAQGIARAVTQVVPTEPHAHAIHADPSNRFVVATCLGGDLLRRFAFDADNAGATTLTDHAEPRLPIEPRGAHRPGPRHLAFHPNGTLLYVLNELDASVAVFGFDADSGALDLRQRVDTAPPGLDGEPWAAEIRIAANGRHLYTSERRSSTLAAFRIDPASGAVTLLGHQPTEAQPRGFALDPGGRWLVAAGEATGGLRCHAIDPHTGALGPGGASLAIGSTPSEIEIIALPGTPEP